MANLGRRRFSRLAFCFGLVLLLAVLFLGSRRNLYASSVYSSTTVTSKTQATTVTQRNQDKDVTKNDYDIDNEPAHKTRGQSPPTFHFDKSYTMQVPDSANGSVDKSVVVTPMTFVWDYELYDGQMLLTKPKDVTVPNVDFDFAVLGLGHIRNIRRDTGVLVSLHEVYLHHFVIQPIYSSGLEARNRKMDDDPIMFFPKGYARHVRANEYPSFGINGHFMSNKNLAPIDGSLELAHKHCNECYYAPNKQLCKPQHSGTFRCCRDCATTTTKDKRIRYRIELDYLVSRDLESFKHVDHWVFAAPTCSANQKYPPDNFCSNKWMMRHGSITNFHQVPQQPNDHPYFKTTGSVVSAASGTLVWGQSHLHNGGVNATFYQNGNIVCTSTTTHGTNPDPAINVGNELDNLIYISSCYDQIPATGIRFEIGDVFTVETYYYGGTNDPRFSSNVTAGEHKNSMSHFLAAVNVDQVDPTFRYDSGEYSVNKMPMLNTDSSLDNDEANGKSSIRGSNLQNYKK